MTFYGISEALDSGQSVTGGPFDLYLLGYRYDGSAPVSFTSGNAFTLGFYDTRALTLADGPVSISWVFEVTSGTGTLRLSDGLDPTHSYNPSVCTNALGDHTVTGPTQLVVGASAGVTLAQLIDGTNEPTVLVEVLSGTVDIEQAKLRVWPASGAIGAWSTTTHPAWTYPDYPGAVPITPIISGPYVGATSYTENVYGADEAADLVSAVDNIRADITGSTLFAIAGTDSGIASMDVLVTTGQADSNGDGIVDTNWAHVSTDLPRGASVIYGDPQPRVPYGVTAPIPPDEVEGDDDGSLTQRDGATSMSWSNASSYVVVNTVTEGSAGTTVKVTSTTIWAKPSGGVTTTWPITGTGPTAVPVGVSDTSTAQVDLAGSPVGWIVQAQASIVDTYPPYRGPGGFFGVSGHDLYSVKYGIQVGATFNPIVYVVNQPPFRAWNPSGVTYLRNFARTDGLGGNAPRNYNKTSVQGSLRNYGYW